MIENRNIKSLWIGKNITDKGINELATYIAGNNSLEVLFFPYNIGITEESVLSLKSLAANGPLTQINLDGTRVNYLARSEIDRILSTPISERSVSIASKTKSAAKLSRSVN